ncbi:hypothetical protein MLD38_029252 [Melastoma candidum]|uniref:Uncharacterized protein n=1 Tax=Melastoma candidum TaxID=119954 RepID=A0ACB9N5B7_9MYRT|nr:hypothetical protein MLD38_029252 [Melastoma candidum]
MANMWKSLLLVAIYVVASPVDADTLDVTKYLQPGHDLSQALATAWKEACASPGLSKLVIPGGTYRLGEVVLSGPCKGPVVLQVDATLVAPVNHNEIKGGGWVTVQNVDQFTLTGSGTFDGQGQYAWTKNDCSKTWNCLSLPINLRFHFITNSLINGITSLDSKQFHVNVLGCRNLTFQYLKITAPGDSPNTDGIHIGRSNGVNIFNVQIKTGDDCVSLGDGCQNVNITGVTCGPGHGISVGSLGKYPGEEPVSGITVKNCTLKNAMNGLRIKTWPASLRGTASNMHFEDIVMDNVGNPVIIDQQYCPWNQCKKNAPSLIKIQDVSFKNIRGTSSTPEVVKLACSSQFPCKNVQFGNIDLVYHGDKGPATTTCTNIRPAIFGNQNPPLCRDLA